MPLPITIALIILGSLIAVVAILLLLYLLYFIRPAKLSLKDSALLCSYAHRGLHNSSYLENSLEAFQNACSVGCGIELDVQLSLDKEVMVFHDYSLTRMTGCEKKLCELTASELAQLRLGSTQQKIPTLKEVLEMVDGRVPILIELKGESFNTSLCAPLASILSGYSGSFCIQSFNPLLLKEMKVLMPEIPRGLLYTDVVKEKNERSLINAAVTAMLTNFLCKPNFISYDIKYRNSFFVWLATRLYKSAKFVWVVNTPEEFTKAKALGECVIFENTEFMH